MSLGRRGGPFPLGQWSTGTFSMVQNEAYASQERPAIFLSTVTGQSRERNRLMNDAHFKNEFHSSVFFRSPFYRDDG
jgi:hypothetical protein